MTVSLGFPIRSGMTERKRFLPVGRNDIPFDRLRVTEEGRDRI